MGKSNKNIGELLIFDYAPNLTVVGGFHALNDGDRETLDKLVDQSDFVALELTLSELNGGTHLVTTPFQRTRGVLSTHHDPSGLEINLGPLENKFYAGPLDSIFLQLWTKLNRYRIEKINRYIVRHGANYRNTDENEMRYCYRIACEKGKTVYLVDMPYHKILLKLCSLDVVSKVKLLFSHLSSVKEPYGIKVILEDDREDHMLRDIEMKEGAPIKALQRKGLLVGGMRHAINYQRRMHYN